MSSDDHECSRCYAWSLQESEAKVVWIMGGNVAAWLGSLQRGQHVQTDRRAVEVISGHGPAG